MKRFLSIVLIALLCVTLIGCGKKEDKSAKKTTASTSAFIGEAEAIAAAEKHFGVKNGSVDKESGNEIALRVVVSATDGSPTYLVALQHFVENSGENNGEEEILGDSYWITKDTVRIDAKTGEVEKP